MRKTITWTCDDCGRVARKQMGFLCWLTYFADLGMHRRIDMEPNRFETICKWNFLPPYGSPPGTPPHNFGHYFDTHISPAQRKCARIATEIQLFATSVEQYRLPQGILDFLVYFFNGLFPYRRRVENFTDSYEHYTTKVALKPLHGILRAINYEIRGRDRFR